MTAPVGDWITNLVDRFVDGVESIRRATTRPVLTAARALVYGVVVVACVLGALVLAGLGLFRLLDVVLPGSSWSAHLVLGTTCCALGSILWSRRGG
jgi:hypothetical protein